MALNRFLKLADRHGRSEFIKTGLTIVQAGASGEREFD
jgi:hypothetical protein